MRRGTHGPELLGGLDGELEVFEGFLVVLSVSPREIEPGNRHAGLEAGGDGVDGARLGTQRPHDLGHRREEAELGSLEDGCHPDWLLQQHTFFESLNHKLCSQLCR